MTKEELAYLLDVPEWAKDDFLWVVESSKILDTINTRESASKFEDIIPESAKEHLLKYTVFLIILA